MHSYGSAKFSQLPWTRRVDGHAMAMSPPQLTTTFCFAILPSASNRNVSVACAYPDVGQRHTRNTEPAGASPLSSTRIAGAASPVVSDRLANSPVKHSRMRARPLYSSRAPLVWLYTLITDASV